MSMRAYSISTEAIEAEWKRVGGDAEKFEIENVMRLERIERRRLQPTEVRLRVLAVSAEHNVVHASLADTVDIAAAHGGTHYPGNSFIGEVIETGRSVQSVDIGEIVLPAGTTRFDAYGYALRTWGFDDPLPGCYAEEVVLPEQMLFRAPLNCGLGFWQIAVLPLRAANAYHLWRRSHDLFRVKVPRERLARLNVLAFGGGVSELFLMLASSEGHRAFYCAGNAVRRSYLEGMGIHPIDQLEFDRFATDGAVRRFRGRMNKLTRRVGMHIVCDMFRGRVFQAGLAALSRAGVNISAGWQLQTGVEYNSAVLSLRQVTLDHAHVETASATAAVASLFGSVFRPRLHDEIYSFEELPRALQELRLGLHTGFAAIRVADDLPAAAGVTD